MNQTDYLKDALGVIQAAILKNPNNEAKAALVASLLKKDISVSWEDFGFQSFKDFAEFLESKGMVKAGYDERKVYTLWSADLALNGGATDLPPSRLKLFRHLRSQIWNAFVAESPDGLRFVNRSTKEVIIAVEDRPTPEREWVEITPISAETQRSWAREFLSQNKIDDENVLAQLEKKGWYTRFPRSLSDVSIGLKRNWSRLRTNKVSQVVQDWCEANDLSFDVAFKSESSSGPKRQQRKDCPQSAQSVTRVHDRRGLVLMALNRMKTDELLELSIPAKYLLVESSGGRGSGS